MSLSQPSKDTTKNVTAWGVRIRWVLVNLGSGYFFNSHSNFTFRKSFEKCPKKGTSAKTPRIWLALNVTNPPSFWLIDSYRTFWDTASGKKPTIFENNPKCHRPSTVKASFDGQMGEKQYRVHCTLLNCTVLMALDRTGWPLQRTSFSSESRIEVWNFELFFGFFFQWIFQEVI